MLVSIKDIKWIEESDFYQSFDHSDDLPLIDEEFVVSDILTNEPLSKVYKSIKFFGGTPFNFLDYLRETGFVKDDLEILKVDRSPEEVSFIDQLIEFVGTPDDKLLEWSVENGHLEYLKYAHKKGFTSNVSIVELAAENGNLDCLKYTIENNFSYDKYNLLEVVAGNGHLDCLKYLIKKGFDVKSIDVSDIIRNGHLECLKYLINLELDYDEEFVNIASEYGQVECLKYLIEKGFPYDSYHVIISAATNGGHLECLKYLHEIGIPWEESLMYNIFKYGNLECFKYAHEHGCPVSQWGHPYAKVDHNLLKYAEKHGFIVRN